MKKSNTVDIYISASRDRESAMVYWCAKMTYGPHVKRENGIYRDENQTTTIGGIIAGLNSMIGSLSRPVTINLYAGNSAQQKEIRNILNNIDAYIKSGWKEKSHSIPNANAWNGFSNLTKARNIPLRSISFNENNNSMDACETDGLLDSYKDSVQASPSITNDSPSPFQY